MKHTALAAALVTASTIGLAQPSYAMSLPAPSALQAAVPTQTTPAYWRGGGWWGPGIGFGIAAGALTAAALASGPYWGGYWGGYPGYAYAPAYAYDYAPAYSYGYGPAYGYAAYGAPAYAYSYGTTYVRPRVGYAYRSVERRVRYGNTWGGARYTYRSGPGRHVTGSMRSARVSYRRR
jgi:hypothetical protein